MRRTTVTGKVKYVQVSANILFSSWHDFIESRKTIPFPSFLSIEAIEALLARQWKNVVDPWRVSFQAHRKALLLVGFLWKESMGKGIQPDSVLDWFFHHTCWWRVVVVLTYTVHAHITATPWYVVYLMCLYNKRFKVFSQPLSKKRLRWMLTPCVLNNLTAQ
jgi:hypothetical protein